MSYPATRIGQRAFSHGDDNDVEAEYDRLRDLARQEASKRSACFDRAHQAHERGDGAAAHQLSEEGKAHGAKMKAYNEQASDFIFRENNAPDRVADDTIDLHGQFVEEAEAILEKRIRYAQQHDQRHLHVIVGKGNHSANHIQKLKPRVEQVCNELGLQYKTEQNEGRIFINLQPMGISMPAPQQAGAAYNHHQQQQHQHHQHQQQQEPPNTMEEFDEIIEGPIVQKLERCCCAVM